MDRLIEVKLHEGVKETGSYNPDDVMFTIEESLTGEEYDQIEGFLHWVHDNGRTFGHNLPEVWDEWQKTIV